MRHVYFLQSLFYLLLFSSAANASSPNLMTFQTKILSPAGTALEAASVNFRFTILDTAGTCTLYVEDYANIDMTGTQGIVSFPLGSGTKTYPPSATSLYEVFDNSVASFPCQAAGTVSPSATDNRQVVMQFNDGSGWQTLPQMAINGVPYANYATRSENLGAYPAANYLRTATLPTCTAGQSLRWDGSTFTCITASGGSTYTGVTSIANASGDITLAPATTTGKVTITSGAPSTSTSTGALVITGGVGVSGAVNVQTNITAGTSIYTPQLYGSSSPSGNILIDGTSDATKGNVILASAGGNVGIGTSTNSSQILNLHRNSGSQVYISMTNATTGSSSIDGLLTGLDAAGDAYFYNYENRDLFLGTNNSVKMTIKSTGKVGIGTTTPSYALDVSGDVNVSGNFRVNGTILSGGSGSSTPTLTGITSITNTSGDITLAPVTATGAVLISSGAASLGTNTGALVVTGGIGLSGAINADGNIWSNGIVSAATSMYSPQLYGSSSASGNILIDGTSHATKGNVILATAGGNVGIGTTTPAVSLDLSAKTDSIRLPGGTTAQRPGTSTNGDLRYNSTLGSIEGYMSNGWKALSQAIVGRVDIAATPYTITSSQAGTYFKYDFASNGVINLPSIATIPDGWQVTIVRKVAKSLTVTPDGTDSFGNGLTTLEMQGRNIQSVTLTNTGGIWAVTAQAEDCIEGHSCWTADVTGGMSQIYVGSINGYQLFTTPGGCTDSPTPTCAGGQDTITGKAWSSNTTTAASPGAAGNTASVLGALAGSSLNSGASICSTCGAQTQSAYLASFSDTTAAKYCEDLNYAGYTDWYLPALREVNFLRDKASAIGGLYPGTYWTSTESSATLAYVVSILLNTASTTTKPTTSPYIRCVRRF